MEKVKGLDVIGSSGSTFFGLCCIGSPAIMAFFSAVGLGFLNNELIIQPLLWGSIVLTGYGLAASKKRHERKEPLMLFAVSVAVIAVTIWFSTIGFLIGITGMITATVMNIVFQKRCAA